MYRENTRILVNPLANTQKECYTYAAFGKSSSNASLCPWRYVGKRWDPELNLYYFGKRYYDPQLARWTTLDPAGFVDGMNLYQYLYKYLDLEERLTWVSKSCTTCTDWRGKIDLAKPE